MNLIIKTVLRIFSKLFSLSFFIFMNESRSLNFCKILLLSISFHYVTSQLLKILLIHRSWHSSAYIKMSQDRTPKCQPLVLIAYNMIIDNDLILDKDKTTNMTFHLYMLKTLVAILTNRVSFCWKSAYMSIKKFD